MSQKKNKHDDSTGYEKALSIINITDKEFNKIRELVHDYFGINLSSEKKMLVVGRLQKYLKEKKCNSFSEFIQIIESDKTQQTLSELINRISTNYTFFFRENEHFDFLKTTALPKIIAKLKKAKNKDLRIWSAGCSTGDEAYSLIITIKEYLGDDYSNWDAVVLATDISNKVLDEAKRGIYGESHLESLSKGIIKKYFNKAEGDLYKVKSDIKSEVIFRRFNLVNVKFPFKKKFDLIVCRNVMIYFDSKTREQLVNRFYDLTEDGGYLLIGHSESIEKKKCPYLFVTPGVYAKGLVNGKKN